jgi:hypothetical protein
MPEGDAVDADRDQQCPNPNCENDELDATPDDPDTDWFCHWCGNLYVGDGDELEVL